MLNTQPTQIIMKDKKVCGLKFVHEGNEEEVRASLIICDPSYVLTCNTSELIELKGKVRIVGKVIRAICILDHAIPNTNDSTSC